MLTQTEICNLAIAMVGGKQILTVDDDIEEARLCKKFYPLVRDRLLRSHPWNFAIKRVQLAELSTVPLFGFDHQFQLPADCLRVLQLDENTDRYKVEGRVVVTNNSTVKALIVFKQTDESKWDANFVDVMATALAVELAYPITQARETKADLMEEYKMKLAQARSFDAQEGVLDQVDASEWLNARF